MRGPRNQAAALGMAAVTATRGAAAPRQVPHHVRATVGLALPLMLSNIAPNAFAAINLSFAGELGATELAGAALALGLLNLALAVFGGLDAAAMALISTAMGTRTNRLRRTRRIVDHGMVSIVLSGLVLAPILWNVDAACRLLGMPDEVTLAARETMRWLIWTPIPYLAFKILRAVSSAAGRTGASLVVVALGIAVNSGLGGLLITGRFGAPRLGVEAVGLATFAGSLAMAVGMALWIALDRDLVRLLWRHRSIRPDLTDFWRLWRLGIPIGLTIFFEAGIFYAAMLAVGRFGVEQLAAHSIAMQVVSLAFKVPIGLGQASTIRIARARAAGDGIAAARAGWTAFGLATAFACATATLLLAAPEGIIALYVDPSGPDTAVVTAYARQFLLYAGLFQIADAAQGVLGGMLRGLHDTFVPMVLAGFGYWGLGLPIGLALAFGLDLQGQGIWIGLAAGLGVVALLLTLRWISRITTTTRPQGRHAEP